MVELQFLTSVVGYKARGRAPALFIVKLGTPRFYIIHQIQHMTKAAQRATSTYACLTTIFSINPIDQSAKPMELVIKTGITYHYIELRFEFSYIRIGSTDPGGERL